MTVAIAPLAWTPEQTLPTPPSATQDTYNITHYPPTTVSLAAADSALFCFYLGFQGNATTGSQPVRLLCWTGTADGTTWTAPPACAWREQPDDGPPPAWSLDAAFFYGQFYCAYTSTGGVTCLPLPPDAAQPSTEPTPIVIAENPAPAGNPALATSGQILVCAYPANGPTANQLWQTSTVDGQNWQTPMRVPGVTLAGDPAFTFFNGRFYCAYPHADATGSADGQLWLTSSADGAAWRTSQQIAGVTLGNGSPALAAFNGTLYCAWTDQTTNLMAFICSPDGVEWSTAQMAPSFVPLEGTPSLCAWNTGLFWASAGLDTDPHPYVFGCVLD